MFFHTASSVFIIFTVSLVLWFMGRRRQRSIPWVF